MRTNGVISLFCLGLSLGSVATTFGEDYNYRRCSLTQMLIEHPMYSFNDEIATAFKQIPLNNRYNNHDLGVKVVKFSTQEFTDQTPEIGKLLSVAYLKRV